MQARPFLTFVCFKWRGPDPQRSYTHVHVNALYRMLAANYRKPFRFVCITDDASGLVEQVETLPLPEMQDIPAPQGKLYPSCYRRLWLFSAEAAKVLPGKVVCLDIDLVICGDVTEFFNRTEQCVFWSDADSNWLKYSGGLFMITTGTRCKVWDTFDPDKSPQITKDAELVGSDQAWISYVLDGEATWNRSHGIYRTRNLTPASKPLILQTPSVHKPWTRSFSTRYKKYAQIWQQYAAEPEALKPMLEKGKYRILKRCTSGQRGDIVELTADEAEHMRRMGLIGSHRIESKRPEVLK